MTEVHARAWGFIPDRLESLLSHWTTPTSPGGGVAILLHPASPLRALEPLWDDWWDAHFMALSGEVRGRTITICCVYAPVLKRQREELFNRLRRRRPPEGLVLLGGDFNCTLDSERDRSHASSTNTDSPALSHLLGAWSLIDTLAPDLLNAESQEDIANFRARSHTYHYRRHEEPASSRLDRWYITVPDFEQVAGSEVVTPCCRSDHDGVALAISPAASVLTTSRARAGRRGLRFPLPAYAEKAVQELSSAHVDHLKTESVNWGCDDGGKAWDVAKDAFRVQCLRTQREAAKKVTRSSKQKIRRLQAALEAERRSASLLETGEGLQGVDELTLRMDLLAFDRVERASSLRQRIVELQQSRASRRQRRTIQQYDGTTAASIRAFFRRFSAKRQRSKPARGALVDGAANALAADWLPILQCEPPDPVAQDAFFDSLPRAARVDVENEVADFVSFSEEEVLDAIAACPRGKASGPDGIPNDWYRDMASELAPILAPLFSAWVRTKQLPPSFAEASVFCIPKTQSPSSGLDYRPISLLNSDYKIFSRVLLNRIRGSLVTTVSPAQFGFVPTRQVHDAIDVWAAMQSLGDRGLLPETATAVLLDFAKAYDTLDRRFLRKYHGYDDSLVHAVDAMHLATTARFIADGDLSEVVSVENGIRQGCPLAPVLFILAIDTLYRRAEADPGLSGLWLDDVTRVTLSGYADDTTAYLAHPREGASLLRLLNEFGTVSGLRINISKSHAVALNAAGPQAAHVDPRRSPDRPSPTPRCLDCVCPVAYDDMGCGTPAAP